jgi:hypothetical protein
MHSVAVIASVFALAIEVDLVGCWLVVGGMGSHETIEQFLPAIRFSLLNLLMDDMVLFLLEFGKLQHCNTNLS